MFDRIEKIVRCNNENLVDLAEIAAPGDKQFFVGAHFSEADLTDTSLSGFDLRGTSFIGARMNKGTILDSNAEVTLFDFSRELGSQSRELFEEVDSIFKRNLEPTQKKLRRFLRTSIPPAYAAKFVKTSGGRNEFKHSQNEPSNIGNEFIWSIFSCISEIKPIISKNSEARVSEIVNLKRLIDRITLLCDPHVDITKKAETSELTNDSIHIPGAGPQSGIRINIDNFFILWGLRENKRDQLIKKELRKLVDGIQRLEVISTDLFNLLPASVDF